MTAYKLDPQTRNGDIGIFITKTGQVTPSDTVPIGQLCTLLRCETSGGIVTVKNPLTGETNAWPIQTGETIAIIYDQVMVTGTSATGLWWAVTGTWIGSNDNRPI